MPGSFLYQHLVNASEEGVDDESITVSFENLNRLGLVEILDDYQVDRSQYIYFEKCETVDKFKSKTSTWKNADTHEVALIPAAARITMLGTAFSRVCLLDKPGDTK